VGRQRRIERRQTALRGRIGAEKAVRGRHDRPFCSGGCLPAARVSTRRNGVELRVIHIVKLTRMVC
jgi:hypothetical protein